MLWEIQVSKCSYDKFRFQKSYATFYHSLWNVSEAERHSSLNEVWFIHKALFLPRPWASEWQNNLLVTSTLSASPFRLWHHNQPRGSIPLTCEVHSGHMFSHLDRQWKAMKRTPFLRWKLCKGLRLLGRLKNEVADSIDLLVDCKCLCLVGLEDSHWM